MKIAHSNNSFYESMKDVRDLIYLFERVGETDFVIVEVNEPFEKEFGITASQCVGKRLQEFLGQEVAAMVTINLQRCVQLSRALEGIVEMATPHGMQLYQTTFIPLQDKTGRVCRVLTVKRRVNAMTTGDDPLLRVGDYTTSLIFPMPSMERVMGLTDLKTVKMELEEQEKQVRELAELAPYGILTMEHLRPVFANKSLLRLAGVDSFEAYLKKGILCFIHPNDRNYIKRLFYQPDTIRPSEKRKQTITGVNAAGELRQLDIRFVRNEMSANRYTQVVVFDITDAIEMERNKAQVVSLSLSMSQCNENRIRIKKELERLIREKNLNTADFNAVFQLLVQFPNDRDDLSRFLDCFEVAHPNFLASLKAYCPALTLNEIKHCACIRMRCQTKDIARLFNVHPSSIQKARVRLKKKLGLAPQLDLREWIESI